MGEDGGQDIAKAYFERLGVNHGDVTVFYVAPMGKPRMTQRDKFLERPCVLRYRAFCDEVRFTANLNSFPSFARRVHWIAFIAMAEGLDQSVKDERLYELHDQKPDRDNIDKAILDALFKEDKAVASGMIEKRWCYNGDERLEIYAE